MLLAASAFRCKTIVRFAHSCTTSLCRVFQRKASARNSPRIGISCYLENATPRFFCLARIVPGKSAETPILPPETAADLALLAHAGNLHQFSVSKNIFANSLKNQKERNGASYLYSPPPQGTGERRKRSVPNRLFFWLFIVTRPKIAMRQEHLRKKLLEFAL